MNLVIVESPTKARTIGRFLGPGYEILASMGHIMDLPKSKLGVDVDNDFLPTFEVVADRKRNISAIKSSAKNAESIILATDPDREGEAIAQHVAELLTKDAKGIRENSRTKKLDNSRKLGKFQRIVFHEITEDAIEEALKHPRDIDKNLVDAQTARRVLDRLVGYKLSPLLWQKVRRGLSAGRVQSIALRLIVEREREIEKFGKEKYWTISAMFAQQLTTDKLTTDKKPEVSNQKLEATQFELVEIDGEKVEVVRKFDVYDGEYKTTLSNIESVEKAKKIIEDVRQNQFKVASVEEKEARRSPGPPHTTSTLQQEASRRFGFSGKRTMTIAQKLYEEGLITYHRTDSVVIGAAAQNAIRNYILKEIGQKYVPEKPRFYKTKQKLAQEAHEAIRPTSVGVRMLEVGSRMGNEFGKLYDLIWRRAVASQMADAILEQTSVLADSGSENSEDSESQTIRKSDNQKVRKSGAQSFPSIPSYRFKANGSVLVFDGFLKLNPQALEDRRLPKFVQGEDLDLREIKDEEHETTPPPRYNDASIIKILEEKGIGRPSTYASIISVIQDRRYVEKDPPTGGGRFKPTPVGIAVNDFLVANFSHIDDIPFTAEMENGLDEIAHGKKEWVPVVRGFYKPLADKLGDVKDVARVKIATEETDEKCPTCGKNLVIRIGKFGKFLSCSGFPECKFSKPVVIETGLMCPKDGGKVIQRKTRKGRLFYGCSNYPACDFASWKLEDIKNTKPQISEQKV